MVIVKSSMTIVPNLMIWITTMGAIFRRKLIPRVRKWGQCRSIIIQDDYMFVFVLSITNGQPQMEFLLVSKNKISSGKATTTRSTLKGLFISMRTLVTFKMFKTGKPPSTDRTDVWSRLVSLDLLQLLGNRLE